MTTATMTRRQLELLIECVDYSANTAFWEGYDLAERGIGSDENWNLIVEYQEILLELRKLTNIMAA